jgi:hypothetical protein
MSSMVRRAGAKGYRPNLGWRANVPKNVLDYKKAVILLRRRDVSGVPGSTGPQMYAGSESGHGQAVTVNPMFPTHASHPMPRSRASALDRRRSSVGVSLKQS